MSLRHENLVAWQRADDLFVAIHQLTLRCFPAHERYLLTSQVRRAAYSVAANIVEGFARRSDKEKLHFLNIAEASLAEVGYCVHVAKRLGYLDKTTFAAIDVQVRRTAAPLVGLIKSEA